MSSLARPARAASLLYSFAWLLFLGVLSVGCERSAGPQLIAATELAPAEAELGDRLEVTGNGFPKGKSARLTFRGTLNRPGEAPEAAEIEAQAAAVSAQRVEVLLSDALQASFCGAAARAKHTTFRGEVEVAFPALAVGAPPVAATIANVTLDLRPASPPRATLEARRAEADRATRYLGLGLEDAPVAAGLAIRSVAPGSRAATAGLVAGDVITTFDGVRVRSLEDLLPSGARARVAVGVRREGAPDSALDVPIDGYRLAAPRDLVAGGLVLLVAAGIIVFFFAPGAGAGVVPWVERRLAMGFVRRAALATLVARATSARAPLVAALAASLLFAAMPFGRYVVLADLDIALLFLVSLTSLITIGWLTGGLRAAAQSASFEVPAALAIACVVLMTGGARLHEIVRAQGGAPWSWYAFKTPLTFALFGLHVSGALAQTSRLPGALAEAECAPVATTRSALAGRVSSLAEWANVLVTSGTSAALFLGGWRLPGVTLGEENGHLGLELLGSAVFLLKAGALAVAITFVRGALPVAPLPQTMRICWRWLVPAAVLGLVATIGWVAFSPGAMVERALAMSTCALVGLGLLRLIHRVRFVVRLGVAENPTSAFL